MRQSTTLRYILEVILIRINAIYPCLEGEGIRIGTPETIIRLQGCRLPGGKNCRHCDTKEAIDPKGGKEMNVRDIVEKVSKIGQDSISITGGEPMNAGKELLKLLNVLTDNYSIALETSGFYIDYEIFSLCDFLSFDIKTPSSGLEVNYDTLDELMEIGEDSQFKCVVMDWKDYDFVKSIYYRYKDVWNERRNLIITPCWKTGSDLDIDFVKKLYRQVLSDRLPVRIILQQHKLLFGSSMRKV